jgi:hypothetical protein
MGVEEFLDLLGEEVEDPDEGPHPFLFFFFFLIVLFYLTRKKARDVNI